jgi:hypothetical protein
MGYEENLPKLTVKNPAQTEQFRKICCHSSKTRGEASGDVRIIYHPKMIVMYFEFKQIECSRLVWLAYVTVILLVIARRHRAAHEFMSTGPFRRHENDIRRRALFMTGSKNSWLPLCCG